MAVVHTLDGSTPMEYADDYYDYNGYGFGAGKDGILCYNTNGRKESNACRQAVLCITVFTPNSE